MNFYPKTTYNQLIVYLQYILNETIFLNFVILKPKSLNLFAIINIVHLYQIHKLLIPYVNTKQ